MNECVSRISLIVWLFLPLKTFALAGELSIPGLAFPAGFPEAARTNLIAAVSLPDSGFIRGEFVNSSTQLYYGGDTAALNAFLQRLAGCPNTTIAITFVSGIADHPAATWKVSHSGITNPARLAVQINFHAGKIHLEDLLIPNILSEMKGEATQQTAKTHAD